LWLFLYVIPLVFAVIGTSKNTRQPTLPKEVSRIAFARVLENPTPRGSGELSKPGHIVMRGTGILTGSLPEPTERQTAIAEPRSRRSDETGRRYDKLAGPLRPNRKRAISPPAFLVWKRCFCTQIRHRMPKPIAESPVMIRTTARERGDIGCMVRRWPRHARLNMFRHGTVGRTDRGKWNTGGDSSSCRETLVEIDTILSGSGGDPSGGTMARDQGSTEWRRSISPRHRLLKKGVIKQVIRHTRRHLSSSGRRGEVG